MGTDDAWKTGKWKVMQSRLGYTDDEMKAFRGNARNEDVLDRAPALRGKTVVLTVVESHGCNSGHKPGDKLHFDAAGNLLTQLGPKKVCAFAVNAAAPMIYAASELFYAGVDPNAMRFRRAGCIDVGLGCGGWGRVVLELSVEDRDKG